MPSCRFFPWIARGDSVGNGKRVDEERAFAFAIFHELPSLARSGRYSPRGGFPPSSTITDFATMPAFDESSLVIKISPPHSDISAAWPWTVRFPALTGDVNPRRARRSITGEPATIWQLIRREPASVSVVCKPECRSPVHRRTPRRSQMVGRWKVAGRRHRQLAPGVDRFGSD